MHHFRTQHLKPFFGKSMRLARKEKKGRLTPIMERPGGYRRKKKLGEEEPRGGGGETAGGACA